ncbi:MAG: hypothetical protein OXFUSZZB_002566 [Candidatus Fervidibacter sp.]|jgi:hypothetical protein
MEREELLTLLAKELPRFLREHPEARYELMGLLAEVFARRDEFQEILSAIREVAQRQEEHSRILEAQGRILNEHTETLREHTKTLEEFGRTLQEHSRILNEHTETLREHTKTLEEFGRTLQEHSRILNEHTQTLREHSRVLQEHSQAIERHGRVLERLVEQQQRLTEEVMRVGRTLSALGARWGYLAEDAFRQGMEAIVADWLGMTVTKWRYWDEAGIVFGRPAWVEVDVVIHDDRHILVQISSSATRGEVAAFYRIGQLYEQVHHVKPRLLLVTVFLDERAKELAQQLGVEVRTA